MLIIIKNLPKDVDKHLLESLIKTTVADAFWFGKGEVKDVHIIQAESRKGSVVEYHCIAMIEPESAAKRVIRVLNAKLFLGIRLRVGEYVVRCWNNDRRQAEKILPGTRQERTADRRRRLRLISRDL